MGKSAFNVGATMSEVESGLPWWKNPNDRFYQKIKKKYPSAVSGNSGVLGGIGNLAGGVIGGVGNVISGLTGGGDQRGGMQGAGFLGGINKSNLQAALGNVAYALSPKSAGGRLGKASAGMATREISAKRKQQEAMRKEQIAAGIRAEKNARDKRAGTGSYKTPKRNTFYVTNKDGSVSTIDKNTGMIINTTDTGIGSSRSDTAIDLFQEDEDAFGRMKKSSRSPTRLEQYQGSPEDFSAMERAGKMPKSQYFTDEDGNISFYKGGELITGKGKGTPKGMKGAGTYKQRTLYKNGDELPIYSEKKYNEAIDNKWSPIKPGKTSIKKGGMSDVVKGAMENWGTNFISEDGTRTTPNIRESLNQQKVFETQEKAYAKGWKVKYKDGEKAYVDDEGFMIDILGNKIKRKPYTEDGVTFHPIPERL